MAKTLGTIKKYMNKVLAACCAVLLTFMTFLVLWQVFTRYVLNSPAAFTEELVKYSLIWTGFIGLCIFHQRAYGTDPGKR